MNVVLIQKYLQKGQSALHPAREQVQVHSVEQSLHQLEGQFVCDPRRRLRQEKLQQAITHVVLPVERALQVQILQSEDDATLNWESCRVTETVSHSCTGLTFHHTW